MRAVDIDEVRGIVLESKPRPIVLLGAGASVTSGVPLVKDLIEMIGRQAFCWRSNRDFHDTSLVRSDWLPWVQGLEWYDATVDIATLYGLHIEELLQPRERRRRFFQEHVLVSPERASAGYASMASLVGKRRIHTVLTSNFDTLAYDSCRRDPTASTVVQIQGPDHADLISTDPALSQVVHVHGVVDHYTDLNLQAEVASIDQRYRDRLVPLIADHPLIVVGYRGAEPSVMRDLLLEAASASRASLPHGVFWCQRARDGEVHPLVAEFAARCGSNFAIVPIPGFDEFMGYLDEGTPRVHLAQPPPPVAFDGAASALPVAAGYDELRVGKTLNTAALDRLALDSGTDHSNDSRLELLDLVRSVDGVRHLTNAGNALFGLGRPLRVVGHADGHPFEMAGNIFDVYERLTATVADLNVPYRIKGAESVDVRPYPPLAIKELLVNALVHRRLDVDEPIEVSINPSHIRITSPGGLLDPEAASTLGEVAFKQYRNPAVAEVLYAAGLMDKHGSGLVDVRRWAAEGGATATFEIGGDNTTFTATLTSRPDSHSDSGIVVPIGAYEIFYVNALQVAITDSVWVGPATAARPREIFQACSGERVPPFVLTGGTLVTLSDLSNPTNPLSRHVDSFERHAPHEFCREPSQERNLVELLNRALARHLQDRGLHVWVKKQRAWFAIEDDHSDKIISYRARTRRADRTVARARDQASKYGYFEHHAVNWAFARAGTTWLLTLDPTWVFTQDGESRLVSRQRTTKLSTKKMSNERNQAVLNHLWFWAWVICGEDENAALSDGGGNVIVHHDPLTQHAFGLPQMIGSGDDEEADPDDLEEDPATAGIDQLEDDGSEIAEDSDDED